MRRWIVLICSFLSLLILTQLAIFNNSYPSNAELFTPSAVSPGYRRFPSALIIGVRKGGTRALLDALALHPSIKTVRKETHFFDANYTKGFEWYRSMMPIADSHQVVIEKTPGYFTSLLAPERIKKFNPKTKLILIVRDPVQRTVSDFTQVFYNKLEQNKTLPIFQDEVFISGTTEINPEYKPLRNSLYDMHLSNWLQYFPIESFLVLNGDVFRGNPLSVLRRIETFLEIPHLIRPEQLIFNERKGFFCFQQRAKDPAKCLGNSKGRTHRKVPQKALDLLRMRLRPHNEIFFEQIGRRFSW